MRLTLIASTAVAMMAPAMSLSQSAAAGVPQPRELVSRIDYEPVWSFDGKRIVFISNRAGPFNVYVMNTDGSSLRRVTSHAGPDDTPSISPDGTRIAFVSEIDGNPELYIVGADGGTPVRLTRTPGADLHPAWSPDGKWILYNAGDSAGTRFDIRTISPTGNPGRSFTQGGISTYASWSLDGRRILYRRSVGEGKSQLRIIDIPAGTDVALTDGAHFDGWPAWSSDGAMIAFASDRGGKFEIYSISSSGGEVRKIASAGERATNPRWGPDGTLMFTARRGRAIDIFVQR